MSIRWQNMLCDKKHVTIRKLCYAHSCRSSYNVKTKLHIYLAMTSNNVETSYISLANICVKNFPSSLNFFAPKSERKNGLKNLT